MIKISPNMMVNDVKQSLEFYRDVLGFQVHMIVPDAEAPIWASITRGQVEIMLQDKNNLIKEYPLLNEREIGGTFNLYIETDNIYELYESCKKNDVPIVKEMNKTFYGADEFGVQDKDGYLIVFAQQATE